MWCRVVSMEIHRHSDLHHVLHSVRYSASLHSGPSAQLQGTSHIVLSVSSYSPSTPLAAGKADLSFSVAQGSVCFCLFLHCCPIPLAFFLVLPPTLQPSNHFLEVCNPVPIGPASYVTETHAEVTSCTHYLGHGE